MNLIEPSLFNDAMAPREVESNKGDFGKVLVIAGSRGKSGAAAMCGQAALRSGAGLVTVATALSVLPAIASSMPELMTEGLNETREGSIAGQDMQAILEGKTVLAIGPGLTTHEETSAFVRSVVQSATIPVVVDADGLNAFAYPSADLLGDRGAIVLTPHPGEMARLTGRDIPGVVANKIELVEISLSNAMFTLC